MNLLSCEILWQNFQVGWCGIASWHSSAASRRGALRSLRDGGNSEYCRSEQCDGGGRLGQGSDFQADFPRGSESFYPMDGILTKKDAFAYWRFIPVFRSRDTDVVWQGKTKGPIHGVANADPGSHEDLIHRKSVVAQLQG